MPTTRASRCGHREPASEPRRVADVRANHPERMHEVFAHSLLLPMLGIPLGEMFDLVGACCRLRGGWSLRLPVRLGTAERSAWRRHATQRVGDQVAPHRVTAPLPISDLDTFVATRDALHRVAEHVVGEGSVSRRRRDPADGVSPAGSPRHC